MAPLRTIIRLAFATVAILVTVAVQFSEASIYSDGFEASPMTNLEPNSLCSIDPMSEASTLFGTNFGYSVNSIAIDTTTGIMYGCATTWSGEYNGLRADVRLERSSQFE
jgi:hypothetical protein